MKCRLNVIFAQREIAKGEFAKKAGISPNTLSALCSNKAEPTLRVAFKIAKALDLKIEDIWEES